MGFRFDSRCFQMGCTFVRRARSDQHQPLHVHGVRHLKPHGFCDPGSPSVLVFMASLRTGEGLVSDASAT